MRPTARAFCQFLKIEKFAWRMKTIKLSYLSARLFRMLFLLSVFFLITSNNVYSKPEPTQLTTPQKEISIDFVKEAGCPIITTDSTTRAILDLDPFGAPKDARIYISFKNNSERPVAAVKFRLRYVNARGEDLGTFHAAQAVILGPGAEARGKWKGNRIHPDTSALKLRVLQVRYSDGAQWNSVKAEVLK